MSTDGDEGEDPLQALLRAIASGEIADLPEAAPAPKKLRRTRANFPRVPSDAWALVSAFLEDAAIAASGSTCTELNAALASGVAWQRRALAQVKDLPGLSAEEKAELVAQASTPRDYGARRRLLKGRVVALSSESAEATALGALVRFCGGRLSRRAGIGTDLLLLGQTCSIPPRRLGLLVAGPDNTLAPRAILGRHRPQGRPPTLLADWLRACLAVGELLPLHKPGCPAFQSPFSQPRMCISPSFPALTGAPADRARKGAETSKRRVATSGAMHRMCCYAPRLLEGLRIAVVGAPEANLQHIRTMIVAGGGSVVDESSRSLTHLVVAPERAGDIVESVRAKGAAVVTSAWLEQTLQHGVPLDERIFSVGRQA